MVHKVHLCPQSVFSDACVAMSRAMTVRCPAQVHYGPQSTSLCPAQVHYGTQSTSLCPAQVHYGPQSTSLSSVSVQRCLCCCAQGYDGELSSTGTHGPQSTSLSSVSVFSDACDCVSRAMTVRCPVQTPTVHKVHLCPRSQSSMMRVYVCPGL